MEHDVFQVTWDHARQTKSCRRAVVKSVLARFPTEETIGWSYSNLMQSMDPLPAGYVATNPSCLMTPVGGETEFYIPVPGQQGSGTLTTTPLQPSLTGITPLPGPSCSSSTSTAAATGQVEDDLMNTLDKYLFEGNEEDIMSLPEFNLPALGDMSPSETSGQVTCFI